MFGRLRLGWERFWMRFAGVDRFGRLSCRLASLFTPPYMDRLRLALLTERPFIDPEAIIRHRDLSIGKCAFIADRTALYQAAGGGAIRLGDGVNILRDGVLETGQGGSIEVGDDTFLHPRCQVMAYKGSVSIGSQVMAAPGCAFYAYNHGSEPDELIKHQPLTTRGGIRVGDGAWLGFGVIVLDGVSIGDGAIVGAGSVVTRDVPDNAIAAGNPARIVSTRDKSG